MTTDGVTVKTSGPFHDFGFTCPVAEMGDGKVYRRAQYQYGTTSHPAAQMSPGAIIYPQMGSAPEEDVKRTFAYAKANGKCVSVRTGGHAYNGSSSCSSDNVQLDISEAFLEWGTPYWGKEDADSEQDEPDPEFTTPPVEGSRPKDGQRLMLRVGASFQLLVLNLKLSENDDANGALFMPTGQCYNVHLGGHSNTGGLGQLSRAFGYLIDNVHTAEIITPEGEMLKIGPKKKDPKKREMFYNMFGGGPGNYAVLTHLTIMPYRSKDYPHARCMKHMMPYNHKYDKKVLAALFNVLVAFKDAPQDYDLCLTAGSGEVDYLWNQFGFANRDSFMSAFYPGSPSRKDEDKWWKYNKASPFAGVVVFFQYSNLDGKPDSYDPKWAAMLKEAFEQGEKGSCCWRCCEAIANCCLSHPPPLIPKELRNVDDDDLSYSISDMVTKLWTYGGVREYNFPYIKCDQITEQEFGEGFADWAAEKLNYLFASGDKGLMASMQSQQFGGAASKVVKNGEKKETSYHFRNGTVIGLNVFYDPSKKDAKELAEKWVSEVEKEGSGPGGKVSPVPKRWFSFPTGSFRMAEEETWKMYFGTEDNYRAALDAKKRLFDPNNLLAANPFLLNYMGRGAAEPMAEATPDVPGAAAAPPADTPPAATREPIETTEPFSDAEFLKGHKKVARERVKKHGLKCDAKAVRVNESDGEE